MCLFFSSAYAQNGLINITIAVTNGGPNPYSGYCEVRKVSDNTLVQSKNWVRLYGTGEEGSAETIGRRTH